MLVEAWIIRSFSNLFIHSDWDHPPTLLPVLGYPPTTRVNGRTDQTESMQLQTSQGSYSKRDYFYISPYRVVCCWCSASKAQCVLIVRADAAKKLWTESRIVPCFHSTSLHMCLLACKEHRRMTRCHSIINARPVVSQFRRFPFEVCFSGCCELCKPAICAPFIPFTWGTS